MPANRSLRPAILENRRRQREDGFAFEFTATNLGIPKEDQLKPARVRRLATTELGILDQLPADLQATVFEGLKELERIQKANEGRPDPQSLAEAVTNNQEFLKTANAFCVAAIISPVVVSTEEEYERNVNAELVIDDIASEDRINLAIMCADSRSQQASTLKLFRPERPADAAPRPTGAVAPTAIRADEPAVAGV